MRAWGAFTIALIVLWSLLPSKIIPGPLDVLAAFPVLWFQEGLGVELWTSLTLNFEAAALMVLMSLLVGYAPRAPGAFGEYSKPVAKAFSMGRFNSFVGLPFLLTILIGDVHWIKVTLLALAMSVFTVPAIQDATSTIPQDEFNDARSLGMNGWRTLWEVVILGRFDQVVDVIRTNLSMGWMMLPMVEGVFRTDGGIGVLLLVENKYLRLDYVYAIILTVGCLGMLQDRAILELKRWITPYAFLEAGQ